MQFAKIEWRNGLPYAAAFDDVYYSSDNGLAETEYVFIKHNQITERLSHLSKPDFTIIETGFGTGLNFFSSAQIFLQHAPSDARLHFISIERYPLHWHDFQQANQLWPMFDKLLDEIAPNYRQLKAGVNQMVLCNKRIALTLYIGDVSEHLPSIKSSADAWFLDGFAPAKNSDMWTPQLFNTMQRLSKTNTTFATFTSAGYVRRQLEAIGFEVQKAAGYGKKREMLYGQL